MYPDAEEDIPKDMPEPRGKEMHITTYVDADHARDKVTRRSVTRSVAAREQHTTDVDLQETTNCGNFHTMDWN